jgi:hypothetical protein
MTRRLAFTKVRDLAKGELAFKILIPRKDELVICPNDLGDGELCGMRLADVVGIDGIVCGSCAIVWRFVEV